MIKNLNDKRTKLEDLPGTKPAVLDDDVLRLVAGGLIPSGGTCTACNDTDGMTCTVCDDED